MAGSWSACAYREGYPWGGGSDEASDKEILDGLYGKIIAGIAELVFSLVLILGYLIWWKLAPAAGAVAALADGVAEVEHVLAD